MYKYFIVSIALTLSLLGCTNSKDQNISSKFISIQGHVKFPEPVEKFGLTLSKIDAQNNLKEVMKIPLDQNNNYKFKLATDSVSFYKLDVYKTNAITFYADDEDLTMNLRGIDTAKMPIKNPPYIFIKGGPKNNVLNTVNYSIYQNYQEMIAIGQVQYEASISDSDAWKEHASGLWDPLYDKFDNQVRNIIQTYIDYPTVVKAIELLSWKRDRKLIFDSYSILAEKYPELEFIQNKEQDLKRKIENELKMSIGNTAPNFTFPNINNKNISLESFRGKYVLIDFWASWCGPCREESPNVKRLYKLYKKRLELVSVSIDTDIDAWKKAIEEDEMEGTLLVAQDSKKIQKDYVFSGIPYMVLLDENGKIIAKNIRGNSLESKLKEIFNN